MTTVDRLAWRISSCGSNGENGVEVAPAGDSVVLRHSKHPSAGTITFPGPAWRAFVHDARDGQAKTNGVATITKIGTDTVVKSLHTTVALHFDAQEWSAFLAGASDGEFDFTSQLAAVQSAAALVEPTSQFFATADIPYRATVNIVSDGDLWVSCWANDGALYSANGDGRGFSANPKDFADIVVNRITGTPTTGLSGIRLSGGNQVGKIWTVGNYNRKPTGMVAVDGNGDGRDELYLAIQDLCTGPGALTFNDAPAASVSRSTDYGRTWQTTTAPMFTDHVFTTIFFLDFGQSNRNASVLGPSGAGYVYAYGLDNNWRDSYSNTVADPQNLYLARVPKGSVQNRASWQFFAGTDASGAPTWSSDISRRVAVLHDERREYPGAVTSDGCSVLSQGGVVYNAPLRRYLYTSWTEYTHEFYEAPNPWGPWKLFLHKDFGPYPWWGDGSAVGPKNGGYATTLPSKFISTDGRQMWLQCNWFTGVGAGSTNYKFSLRPLTVTPYQPGTPSNPANPLVNLARAADAVPIDKTSHYGKLASLNDRNTSASEDSWDGTTKDADRWGITWSKPYNLDRVVYTTGTMFPDGGWFASGLTVQVRKNFVWTPVTGLAINPAYPYNASAGPSKRFTLTFANTSGDGVRIVGSPGGNAHFTSISELEAYFDG
jgi:hypothetical protein